MDLICPRCTEPWDFDSLHEEADESDRTYAQVAADFRTRGCLALETAFGAMECKPVNNLRSMVADAMYDLLGDDMDGAAAMMEDFEWAGMLDD
jgi:hypothetical protein